MKRMHQHWIWISIFFCVFFVACQTVNEEPTAGDPIPLSGEPALFAKLVITCGRNDPNEITFTENGERHPIDPCADRVTLQTYGLGDDEVLLIEGDIEFNSTFTWQHVDQLSEGLTATFKVNGSDLQVTEPIVASIRIICDGVEADVIQFHSDGEKATVTGLCAKIVFEGNLPEGAFIEIHTHDQQIQTVALGGAMRNLSYPLTLYYGVYGEMYLPEEQ